MKKEYYEKIYYLRIISCLLILLYHLNILKGGFLAVCTFLTLSGYLSCLSALRKDDFSIKEYYKGRLKKIYLPLILVVFFTVIIARCISSIGWINLKQESLSVLFGYNNFWQLNANMDYFTKSVNSPFIHLWFISILMQYEIIFPIALILLRKIDTKLKKNISNIIIITLLIITLFTFIYMSITQDKMQVYYNSFARSFSFIFGILLAIIHCKYNIKIAQHFYKYKNIIFGVYLAVLIALCIFVSSETNAYAIFMIITTIISIRLIEYATLKDRKNKRKSKFSKYLIDCTYEVYLVQYPIIFFLQSLFSNKGIEVFITLLLTSIIAYILNLFINLKYRNKYINIIKISSISLIAILGSLVILSEKDHSIEMKELENKLNENLKIIELKNSNYNAKIIEEQEEWQKKLESMENEQEYTKELVRNLPVIGIGDSVLLGAIDEFYSQFPNGYFDGKVSRTIGQAKDLMQELKDNGNLGNILILSLANNGDYSERKNRDFIEFLENREIYWVNAVGADDPEFNDRFKEFAKDYSNIHIVDWEQGSKNHPEYFYADGIHVKGDGVKAYVDTIYNAIYNNYLKNFENKKKEILQEHENELNTRIAFYGNNLLTNSYEYLSKKFNDVALNVKSDYNYNTLYNDLKDKKDNNNLENRIVFLLDQDAKMTSDEYKKIIELCDNHQIYICNCVNMDCDELINDDNVKIINFYDEIKNNIDYVLADKVHLSAKGNEELVNMLFNEMIN